MQRPWHGNTICITCPLWGEWGPLMVPLMLAWTNCWTNSPPASDLGPRDAHVMPFEYILLVTDTIGPHTQSRQVVQEQIYGVPIVRIFNTLRPRQDGHLFPDDIFKSIFFNENVQILIKISWTFVPEAPINNIPALVQIMAWRRPGDKPVSEAIGQHWIPLTKGQ